MPTWKERARHLELEIHALYFAARDPRTPWYAKFTAGAVVALAVSPIDLVPDFIPVIGYLDDVIVLPLGVALVKRMVPPEVMDECRERAKTAQAANPRGRYVVMGCIITLWLAMTVSAILLALRHWHR